MGMKLWPFRRAAPAPDAAPAADTVTAASQVLADRKASIRRAEHQAQIDLARQMRAELGLSDKIRYYP